MLCGAKTQRYVGLSQPTISPTVTSPSGALNSRKMEDHGLIFELAETADSIARQEFAAEIKYPVFACSQRVYEPQKVVPSLAEFVYFDGNLADA